MPELTQEDLTVVRSSDSPDYHIRKEDNADREQEVINRLLTEKEVTVYHRLASADDFDGIQANGTKGSYRVRTQGGVWQLTYFTLLYPSKVDDKSTAVTLNQGDRKMRIYDNREDKKPSLHQLIENGFDGSIEVGGVGVPLDQKYMLRLFDGSILKGKFKKLVADGPEST